MLSGLAKCSQWVPGHRGYSETADTQGLGSGSCTLAQLHGLLTDWPLEAPP